MEQKASMVKQKAWLSAPMQGSQGQKLRAVRQKPGFLSKHMLLGAKSEHAEAKSMAFSAKCKAARAKSLVL